MKNQSSTDTGNGHITQTERLYYLDWFRVIAMTGFGSLLFY
jgi:hypothetical protein